MQTFRSSESSFNPQKLLESDHFGCGKHEKTSKLASRPSGPTGKIEAPLEDEFPSEKRAHICGCYVRFREITHDNGIMNLTNGIFKKTLSFLSMDFDWKLSFGQEACIDNTTDNFSMGSYHLTIPLTIAVQGSFLCNLATGGFYMLLSGSVHWAKDFQKFIDFPCHQLKWQPSTGSLFLQDPFHWCFNMTTWPLMLPYFSRKLDPPTPNTHMAPPLGPKNFPSTSRCHFLPPGTNETGIQKRVGKKWYCYGQTIMR